MLGVEVSGDLVQLGVESLVEGVVERQHGTHIAKIPTYVRSDNQNRIYVRDDLRTAIAPNDGSMSERTEGWASRSSQRVTRSPDVLLSSRLNAHGVRRSLGSGCVVQPTRLPLPILGLLVLAACGVPAAAAYDDDNAANGLRRNWRLHHQRRARDHRRSDDDRGADDHPRANDRSATDHAGVDRHRSRRRIRRVGPQQAPASRAPAAPRPRSHAGATTTAVPTSRKVFVCKYVGKPGDDERLQTGQNPISVSVNAIPLPQRPSPLIFR